MLSLLYCLKNFAYLHAECGFFLFPLLRQEAPFRADGSQRQKLPKAGEVCQGIYE